MKANLSDNQVERLFKFGLERMKSSRVYPSPNDSYHGEYRCAFSNNEFTSPSGLTAENSFFYINTEDRDVQVLSVTPEILRRIREFLLYEGEYVVLHNSMMPTIQFQTWSRIVNMIYTVRMLESHSKWVFDMREWAGDVKLGLTNDWSSDSVREVLRGQLDINYAVQVITFMLNVHTSPITLHYSITTTSIADGRSIYGVLVTPDVEKCEMHYRQFKSRYTYTHRYYGDSYLIEKGTLSYDNIQDMYKCLQESIGQISKINQTGDILDMDVTTGIRTFTSKREGFQFSWEKS